MPDDDQGEEDRKATPEEIAEAKQRFAGHEPAAPELFSRPAYSPGIRGDVSIHAADNEDDEAVAEPAE